MGNPLRWPWVWIKTHVWGSPAEPLFESALRRGWRDFKEALQGWPFVVLEVTGGVLLGLVTWWMGIVFVAGGFAVFLLGAAASAPVKQRNEAREEVRRLTAAEEPFTVRLLGAPESGTRVVTGKELLGFLAPQVLTAHLEVTSVHGFVPRCTALVRNVYAVERPTEDGEKGWLARQAREPRYLRWSSTGARTQDMAAGTPYRIDLATFDQNVKPYGFHLVAADGETREPYPSGWWKVDVLISSESETMRQPQLVEILIGMGRRERPPPPLNLQRWDRIGESLLATPRESED